MTLLAFVKIIFEGSGSHNVGSQVPRHKGFTSMVSNNQSVSKRLNRLFFVYLPGDVCRSI